MGLMTAPDTNSFQIYGAIELRYSAGGWQGNCLRSIQPVSIGSYPARNYVCQLLRRSVVEFEAAQRQRS